MSNATEKIRQADVLRVIDSDTGLIRRFCQGYGLECDLVRAEAPIPGSFWGESEAGLIGTTVYVREDTPLHSLLHETCHYICMDNMRRTGLDTNAGGDYNEENAVCYLQILLADRLPPLNHERMMADMDNWGYSFRLGSSKRWFHEDAEDARDWLSHHGIIDIQGKPTGRLRQ